MSAAILAGVLALSVTLAAGPAVARMLRRSGTVDVPNERSLHSAPVPRGGGIACCLGVVAASACVALAGSPVPWAAVGGALALAAVGYVDDRIGLPVYPRLAAQVAVGAAIGLAIGGTTTTLYGALLVPAVVNAVNFMDGINGITSLTMLTWGVVTLAVASGHALPGLAVLSALAAGSALGFLPWNAPNARLFLGDSGSYLFGGLAASGLLLALNSSGTTALLVLSPLLVYLADTALTLTRRVARRQPAFKAHRDHVYQRLVTNARLPHGLVAAWAASIALATAVVWSVVANVWLAAAFTAALLGAYVVSAPLLGAARANVSPAQGTAA